MGKGLGYFQKKLVWPVTKFSILLRVKVMRIKHRGTFTYQTGKNIKDWKSSVCFLFHCLREIKFVILDCD